jgi:hypothetical protein
MYFARRTARIVFLTKEGSAMPAIEDILASRIPPSAPPSVQAAVKNALAAYTDVRAKRETLAKNANLSPVGIVDESRKYIATNTAKRIALVRSTVANFQKEIAARKARTLPPSPTAADAALMPEFRTALRSMSLKDQHKLLFSDPLNVQVLQACLGAPAALSGVAEDVLAKAVERYVAITHPAELAAIAEDEESLAVLNAAVGMTCLAAKSIGEFPTDAVLEEFIETNAPTVRAPADPTMMVFSAPTLPPVSQKTSEELQADALAYGRAEVARMRAAGEL